MKYAFMTFSTPELSLAENLQLAREIGYDGIEPRADSHHQHGVELSTSLREKKEIKRMASDSGVAICCIATSITYLKDPDKVADMVESTRRYIELASEVGCPRLRVFGSGSGEVEGFSFRHRQQLADALSQVAGMAAQHAVQICLETHDYWCNPEDVEAVMRLVNQPMIGVNWDIMHPVRACGFTVESSYQHLAPWILHFHMHQGTTHPEKLELLSLNDPAGAYDHKTAIKLLARDGYSGYMSGEWIRWDGTEALPRELRAIKEIEARALAEL